MVALAVWLVACGIVLCTVYLAAMAVVGVFLALMAGVVELAERIWPVTSAARRRAAMTPQQAAVDRMFAEPPTTDQVVPRMLARLPYKAPSGPRQ
jgi:hypothetical protein